MEPGDKKTIHLEPAEAYGDVRPELIIDFPIDQVPNVDQLSEGTKIFLQGPAGQPIPATVTKITDEAVTVDANHDLAGKPLNFDLELVEVED